MTSVTPRGEARAFFDAALEANHDQCILWPYSDFGKGYGQIQLDGRSRRVHVEVCRRAHGEKPPGYQVAHSCNTPACINPRHLSWKTPRQNADDRRANGTHPTGERNPRARLTEDDVKAIRRLRGTGLTYSALAAQFGVAWQTVGDICMGRTWTADQRE